MKSLIVAASPLAGHTLPLLNIAGRLRAAGHRITFVGGRRFGSAALDLGLDVDPLRGRADYDDRRMAEYFPDSSGMPPGLERLNRETVEIFGDTIPDQHDQIQEILAADPDQALITDILFAGAFPAACGVGRRPSTWVSVGIAPVYARSVDTTPFGPAPVNPGQSDAQANLDGFAAFSGALGPAFGHIADIIESLGGKLPAADWISTLYELPDVVAQLSVPEFEFYRSDLPATLHYVGLAPPPTASSPLPGWWSELDDDRPVVLVTQGTLANRDLTELVLPTLHALAEENCLVVAALGRPVSDLAEPLPTNVRAAEYLPFDRLLPHVNLFVTNGGYGATQQALAAGVPVVVAGATEDKPATAARVAHHGVGIDLATDRPSPEQIRAAVSSALADPGFRERAVALSGAYSRYDAPRLIETLAAAE